MPDVLDLIQSNPELARAIAPPEQVANPATAPDAGYSPEVAQFMQPSWAAARAARTNAHLAGDDFQNTLAHHHAAVADAEATARAYEALNTLHMHAVQQQETGGALAALHGIKAGDPDYEQRFLQAGTDFPNANWNRIHEIYQPMHEAHKAHTQMTSSLQAQRAEEQGMKHVFDALGKRLITEDDLGIGANGQPNNPKLWQQTQAGPKLDVMAVRKLAADREAGQPQALTKDEEMIMKRYPDAKSANALFNASDNDPTTRAHKALLWSAYNKIVRPTPQASPAAGAPITTQRPPTTSADSFFHNG